jgi:hypothetical protein
MADNAIFIHDHSPSESQDFNGWNGGRFLFPR